MTSGQPVTGFGVWIGIHGFSGLLGSLPAELAIRILGSGLHGHALHFLETVVTGRIQACRSASAETSTEDN